MLIVGACGVALIGVLGITWAVLSERTTGEDRTWQDK